MRIKLEVRYIDGQPVLYTPTGEQVPIAEAFKAFHVEEGECLPISIRITDGEDDDDDEEKRGVNFADFIRSLKERWPDGYFVTKNGRRLKIRGIDLEQ